MRLKNIKLAGFKSFVDPTNVQLTSNMVAVIGPNGCGKSNIIDAVRWVLGETSAKNLRGESMADVIFNGSNARKPIGQASIELVFDNSDGTLGGEYAKFSEISVKRQVTRDSQSNYYVNGAKCRRRDITDIFLGTGLGPRSYAIIEQGMISRLIESKPEELRVFVEEAAGISKYKERRRETETRIRHTRENLERLTDLREELDRQLQRLKRQSESAKKYKELKTEERSVNAELKALQWQSLQEQSSGHRQAISQAEINLEASIAKQRSLDTTIEQLREKQTESNDFFNEVQGVYYSLGADIARVEQSISHHEQRAQQLAQDLKETITNAEESLTHLQEDEANLENWQNEIKTIEPKLNELRSIAENSTNELKLAEDSMQSWQNDWDSFNLEAAEPQKNAEVQKTKISQIELSLSGLDQRLNRMNDELLASDITSQKTELDELNVYIKEKNDFLSNLDANLKSLNQKLIEKRLLQKDLLEKINIERLSLQDKKGRLSSLEALQRNSSKEEEDILNEWKNENNLKSSPKLIDTIDVEKGWELAVEIVLGKKLEALTVNSLDKFFNTLNKVSNIDFSLIEQQDKEITTSGKISLQTLDSKIIGNNISTFADGIFVAESINEASSYKKHLNTHQSIITKDGVWIGKNWLRIVSKSDHKAGFISREKEINELKINISDLKKRITEFDNQLSKATDDLFNAEKNKDDVIKNKTDNEQDLSNYKARVAAIEAKIDQMSNRHLTIKEDIELAKNNKNQQQELLSNLKIQLQDSLNLITKVEEKREILLFSRDKARDHLSICKDSAMKDNVALQEITVRVEGLRTQIDSIKSTINRLSTQVNLLKDKRTTLEQSQIENIAPVDDLKETLSKKLTERIEIEEKLKNARLKVESIDHEMRENESKRVNTEQTTNAIREELEKVRLDGQELNIRSKTIVEQLEENGFELDAVIKSLPIDANLDKWIDLAKVLESKITKLGAINLAAIEEYESESERKTYLDAQNDELESALSTLSNAIQKIDRETKNLFKETFDKLNSSLQDLFPKVFGGGNAYLEMTGEDLLDTGIAIMARPPGKRNTTIHLLSGGEKALTAIALVFSIFQLNPAPFCMLDEVDAPLDDTNTGRYARLIKEMSERVQFIFITHNKITMEMADHLMGVTMHEPGCSRLVSVDIDEAVALATA